MLPGMMMNYALNSANGNIELSSQCRSAISPISRLMGISNHLYLFVCQLTCAVLFAWRADSA